MMIRKISILRGAIALGLGVISGGAQAESISDVSTRCTALERADFSQIQDAPTQIMDTKLVGPNGASPGYCQVSGNIAPHVGFVLRLPSRDWNGKFMGLGCGSLCGFTTHIAKCQEPLRKGYACIVTDDGHQSSSTDWAYNNWPALVDYFVRASHVTALAGKAVVQHYYDQAPRKSYFMGCSAGGREAMMMAQRYPRDFDGIIAGDPSINQMGIRLNLLWGQRALTGGAREPLLGHANLDVLHRAVLARCDLNDGIKDGLIGDPRACDFDASTLRCTAGGQEIECLTSKQIEAVKNIYNGPVTSKGEQIYMPGAMKGSETFWLSWFGAGVRPFVQDAFRYYVFQPSPGPSWKAEDFNFDRDPDRMALMEGLFSSVNPDLRKFKAAGGKLLVYVGWSDAAGMPLHTADYYEIAEKTMGGQAATQEFLRLFAMPGLGHCAGETAVDWLGALEAWVEHGEEPKRLVSTYMNHDKQVEFSRPVYPYPTRVKYLGRGNPKEAASFGPADH